MINQSWPLKKFFSSSFKHRKFSIEFILPAARYMSSIDWLIYLLYYQFSIAGIRNFYKLRGFKQHKYVIFQPWRSKVWYVLTRLTSSQATIFSGGCREEFIFLLIWAVGSLQSLAIIGLGQLFSYWLQVEGCFQILEASAFLGSWLPASIFKASNGELNLVLLMLHLLDSFVCLSLKDNVISRAYLHNRG